MFVSRLRGLDGMEAASYYRFSQFLKMHYHIDSHSVTKVQQ